MFLQLFKKNRPYVIFLVPVLAFALWALTFFDTNKPILLDSQTSYVYNMIVELFKGNRALLVAAGLVSVVVQAFMLIRLNFKYIFIEEKTYLPSFLFIIYISLFPQLHYLHPLLLANFFILFSINRSFVYENSRNKFGHYFESGFFIGLASLIYPYSIVFVIIIWYSLFVLRPSFNWREWASSIFGVFTPIILYFSILFLIDKPQVIYNHINLYTYVAQPGIRFGVYSKIALGVLSFVFLIGLFKTLSTARVKKISSRKYIYMFLRIMVFTLVAFYIPAVSYELIVFLAMPISITQTMFFVEIKNKWIAELMFLLVIIPAFVIVFFY